MNTSRCPHGGVRLSNFLYADACPHCHENLKVETPDSGPKKDPHKVQPWLVRGIYTTPRRHGS